MATSVRPTNLTFADGGRTYEDMEMRIRGLLPTLRPAERRVAEHVLANLAVAAGYNISDIADHAQTSLTTVTRLCKALGFAGYAEFRLALATDVGRLQSRAWSQGIGTNIAPDDPLDRVLARVVEADKRTLEATASQLDLAALGEAVDALVGAGRIDLYAISGSGAIAVAMHLRLHRIGCTSFVWTDVHDALTSAALLGPSDVALGISHSGETREVIEPLRVARQKGATSIAITNFPQSPLTDGADIILTTAALDTPFRPGGIASQHAQLLLLDCLIIGIAQRTYAKTEAALAATEEVVRGHRVRASKRRRPA